MLREVELRRLPASTAARWQRLVEEAPILAAPARCLHPNVALLVALVGALVFAAAFQRLHDGPTALELRLDLAPRALAGLVGTLLVVGGLRELVLAHRPLARRGRFLFRWGYAEIEHRSVRFVRGTEVQHEVTIGPPRLTGASEISIRLHDDHGWSTRFELLGCELDVPTAALDGLGEPPDAEGAGYRDAGHRLLDAPRARRRPWRAALVATAILTTAAAPAVVRTVSVIVYAGSPDPGLRYQRWELLRASYPLLAPLADAAQHELVAAAGARIASDIRTPYREVLDHLLATEHYPSVRVEMCRGLQYDRAWLDFRSPILDPYFSFAWPWRHRRVVPATLSSSCDVEWPRDGGPFHVNLTWELRHGPSRVLRSATIPHEPIHRLAGCAREPSERRAAAVLVAQTIARDMFVEEHVPAVTPYETLRACAEREVEAIEVEDAYSSAFGDAH